MIGYFARIVLFPILEKIKEGKHTGLVIRNRHVLSQTEMKSVYSSSPRMAWV